MTIRVSSSVLRRVIASAAKTPKVERCGLLWAKDNRVFAMQPTRNVSTTSATQFEIDPVALIAAYRRARASRWLTLAGHWHSHPSGDAMPSRRDADSAIADGMLWLIVAGNVARLWRAVEHGALHDRFDPVAFAIGRDIRVDKTGTGVRMHPCGPVGEPCLLESIA